MKYRIIKTTDGRHEGELLSLDVEKKQVLCSVKDHVDEFPQVFDMKNKIIKSSNYTIIFKGE